jgi:hypothetical protein
MTSLSDVFNNALQAAGVDPVGLGASVPALDASGIPSLGSMGLNEVSAEEVVKALKEAEGNAPAASVHIDMGDRDY